MNCKLVKHNCIKNPALIVIAIVIILGVNRGEVCTPHLISNQSEVQCTVHSILSLSLSPILFLSLSLAALRHMSWLQAHIHTHMLAHISTHPALAGPALMTHQDVYRVAGSFIRALQSLLQ